MPKLTPAPFRRAFFVAAALIAGAAFAGPPPSATPPPLAQVGKPNAAEAAQILEQFRHSGWFGYVEFDLHALPKRGDEVVYHGRLWGGRNEQGAVTRIEVVDAKGQIHRYLLQNGGRPAVWTVAGGHPVPVETKALFDPLIPGVEITAFDLQMPYLYWPQPAIESVVRVRGRPAYVFAFQTPPGFSTGSVPLKTVRADFDAQFHVPIQTEWWNGRTVLKTLSLVDLKKVGENWIPKSFDLRNEQTRDKTRFEVTAVALGIEFSSAVFAPAALNEPVAPPAADRIIHVE